MSVLLILRGIQASGKSTFAKAWVEESPTTRARINRDDIRFQLFGKYWGVDETTVTKVQDASLVALLSNSTDVVLDNTNLDIRNVRPVLKLAASVGAEVEYKDFPVSLATALYRNALRERKVDQDVISKYYDKYVKNGFPPIPKWRDPLAGYEFKPYVRGRIAAFSFDIDGTLSHSESVRGPYDTSKYHMDTVDGNVREVLQNFRLDGYKIIILSGRNEDFRGVTEEWLDDMHISFDELLMRPSDQPGVNDAIIKSDLVDKHISGKYDIVMHYDDRDRVVKALRLKGMKVAQVEPGDF